MSKIPPVDQMLRLLRAQPVLGKSAPQEIHRPQRRDVQVGDQRRSKFEAADYVVRQVRQIADDDPQRRRRAFRAFLEGRLIELLGPDALGLPSFGTLLDQVEHTMSGDDDMSRAMEAVGDQLLSGAGEARTYERLAHAFGRRAVSPDTAIGTAPGEG